MFGQSPNKPREEHELPEREADAAVSSRVQRFQQTDVPPDSNGPDSNGPDSSGLGGLSRGATGERRWLTVMFCDLVGSASMSEQLDPEDLHEVIVRYQQAAANPVTNYGGYIAQYLGDGILVYFGYPRALEDAPRRAVLAALEITRAIASIAPDVKRKLRVDLAVRIGIQTGRVVMGVVGEGDRPEALALGETPNVAARLQSAAGVGEVVIGDATRRLVEGFFELENLGPLHLKGIGQAVNAYRAVRSLTSETRFDVALAGGLVPFVGRQPELELLQDELARARSGSARRVVIAGEPGVGKSRLLRNFLEHLPEGTRRLSGRCSPYHRASAFSALLDMLGRALGIGTDDLAAEKLQKLERGLSEIGGLDATALPILARFLSIASRDLDAELSNLSPQRQKQLTVQVLRDLLAELAARGPLVISVEDTHWIDPSSAQFLKDLELPGTLFIYTTRRGQDFILALGEELTTVHLGPLSREESHQMFLTFVGNRAPAELVSRVLDRTEGVPLFIEEQARLLRDARVVEASSDGPSSSRRFDFAVAETLLDSLLAHLDSLHENARTVARLAAVLGRSFSHDLLQRVAPFGGPPLQNAVAELLLSGVLVRRGEVGRPSYRFRHALIQDVAYDSLLKATRREYHARCARALHAHFPELVRSQPDFVAYHHAQALEPERSIQHYEAAAALASAKWALEEASQFLEMALEQLPLLADETERRRTEMRLLLALGPPLMSLRGYAAPSVATTFARVRELCSSDGVDAQMFPALAGLWQYHMVRGNLEQAMVLGRELYELGARESSAMMLLVARRALGTTHFLKGDLEDALTHTSAGWEEYDIQKYGNLAARFGNDPGVGHGVYLAWALWLHGEGNRARRQALSTLELARALKHPLSIAFSACYAGIVHQLCGDSDLAYELSQSARTVADEHGLSLWAALSQVVSGWARVERGDAGGLPDMMEGVQGWLRTGARAGMTFFPALLADVKLQRNDCAQALEHIVEAERMIAENAEHFYEAEVLRLRGEWAARTGDIGAARACFDASLELARRQTCRSFELRAALSAECWSRDSESHANALQRLQAVHDVFPEDEDTTDIRRARTLLKETGRVPDELGS